MTHADSERRARAWRELAVRHIERANTFPRDREYWLEQAAAANDAARIAAINALGSWL